MPFFDDLFGHFGDFGGEIEGREQEEQEQKQEQKQEIEEKTEEEQEHVPAAKEAQTQGGPSTRIKEKTVKRPAEFPSWIHHSPKSTTSLPSELLEKSEQTISEQQSRILALEKSYNGLLVQYVKMAKVQRTRDVDEEKVVGGSGRQSNDLEKEIADLTATIKKQADQILWAENIMHTIDLEKKELRNRLAEVEKLHGCSELSVRRRDRDMDVESFRKIKEKLMDENSLLQLQSASQTQLLEKKEVEIAELKDQVATAEEALKAIDVSNKLVMEGIDTYKRDNGVRLAAHIQLEDQLKTQLGEKETIIAELQQQISNQEQSLAGAEVEIASLNSMIDSLQNHQVNDQEHPITQEEIEIKNLNSVIDSLQNEMAKENNNKDNMIEHLKVQFIHKSLIIEANETKIKEMKQANSDKNGKIVTLQTSIAALQKQIEIQGRIDKEDTIYEQYEYIKELQNSLVLETQSNTEKAQKINSLKEQLEKEVQAKNEKDFMLESIKSALKLESQANTDKGIMIAGLRADYAKIDEANTTKGALIFSLKTQYAELDESWRAISKELTSRHLDLQKELGKQEKRFQSDLCKKDESVTRIRNDKGEQIVYYRSMMEGCQRIIKERDQVILRTRESLRDVSQKYSEMEEKLKSVEATNNQHWALLEISRDNVERLKDKRSTAETIAEQWKEEHDKIFEVLRRKDDSIKHLEAGIEQLERRRSAAKTNFKQMEKEHYKVFISQNRKINKFQARIQEERDAVNALKLENEGLRKEWEAMKWEEEAEDSDVASVDSQDSDDEVVEEDSIDEDLDEMHSYEDVQADYESDLEREEEKSEDVDNTATTELVNGANVADDLDEELLYESEVEREDEKSDDEWSVMSGSSAQGDAEQNEDESFTDVASEASDEEPVAIIELNGHESRAGLGKQQTGAFASFLSRSGLKNM